MASEHERERGTEYYRLTVAAQLVGIPPSRVRRYLKIGLVQPSKVDRTGPLLGTAEMLRLRKIRRLTSDLGLNVAGVEVVLRLLDEIEALRAGLEQPPAGGGRQIGSERVIGQGSR